MTQSNEPTVESAELTPTSRFNLLRILKITAITVTGLVVVFWVKNKLSGSVDGEVTATVGTNDES